MEQSKHLAISTVALNSDKDYLNMRYEKHIIDYLIRDGTYPIYLTLYIELILFSAEVQKDLFLFFKKGKILMVSMGVIYFVDRKRRYIKKKC